MERFQLECTSHHFEGGRDAAQDAAEREREIRAERQPGELQMRDAAQDAAERTVVSVLIIIFVECFGRRSCCALFTEF